MTGKLQGRYSTTANITIPCDCESNSYYIENISNAEILLEHFYCTFNRAKANKTEFQLTTSIEDDDEYIGMKLFACPQG